MAHYGAFEVQEEQDEGPRRPRTARQIVVVLATVTLCGLGAFFYGLQSARPLDRTATQAQAPQPSAAAGETPQDPNQMFALTGFSETFDDDLDVSRWTTTVPNRTAAGIGVELRGEYLGLVIAAHTGHPVIESRGDAPAVWLPAPLGFEWMVQVRVSFGADESQWILGQSAGLTVVDERNGMPEVNVELRYDKRDEGQDHEIRGQVVAMRVHSSLDNTWTDIGISPGKLSGEWIALRLARLETGQYMGFYATKMHDNFRFWQRVGITTNAVTLGRHVGLMLRTPDPTNSTEVEAGWTEAIFDDFSADFSADASRDFRINIAHNRPTEFNAPSADPAEAAPVCVDGLVLETQAATNSELWCQSADEDRRGSDSPIWEVQLQRSVEVGYVTLLGRNGPCRTRLFSGASCDGINSVEEFGHHYIGPDEGFEIGVSAESCVKEGSDGAQESEAEDDIAGCGSQLCGRVRQMIGGRQIYTVDCGGKEGAYVWVRLPGEQRVIDLREIEVYPTIVVYTPGTDTAGGLHPTELPPKDEVPAGGVEEMRAAAAKEAGFETGVKNSNDCPAGSFPIQDMAECEEAATSIGLTDKTVEVEETDDFPRGCYIYAGKEVWFNMHPVGDANWEAVLICEQYDNSTSTTSGPTSWRDKKTSAPQWLAFFVDPVPGGIPGHAVGLPSNAANVTDCASRCVARPNCESFEFSKHHPKTPGWGDCFLNDCKPPDCDVSLEHGHEEFETYAMSDNIPPELIAQAMMFLAAKHGGLGQWELPIIGTLGSYDIWREGPKVATLDECKKACVDLIICNSIDFAPEPTDECPESSCCQLNSRVMAEGGNSGLEDWRYYELIRPRYWETRGTFVNGTFYPHVTTVAPVTTEAYQLTTFANESMGWRAEAEAMAEHEDDEEEQTEGEEGEMEEYEVGERVPGVLKIDGIAAGVPEAATSPQVGGAIAISGVTDPYDVSFDMLEAIQGKMVGAAPGASTDDATVAVQGGPSTAEMAAAREAEALAAALAAITTPAPECLFCEKQTGESCRFGSCQEWSNSVCINGQCTCRGDDCAKDGICGPCMYWSNVCERDTGTSCQFMGCAEHRNAVCVDNQCMCREGDCAWDGVCTAQGEPPSSASGGGFLPRRVSATIRASAARRDELFIDFDVQNVESWEAARAAAAAYEDPSFADQLESSLQVLFTESLAIKAEKQAAAAAAAARAEAAEQARLEAEEARAEAQRQREAALAAKEAEMQGNMLKLFALFFVCCFSCCCLCCCRTSAVDPAMSSDPRFAQFAQMLKQGMPEADIRAAMAMEGLSEAQMDAFFAGLPDPEPWRIVGPPMNTLPQYQKYVRMQRDGLSEGEIRGKMTVDGLSAARQDAFFAGEPDPEAWRSLSPPLNTLPDFQRFVEMQKAGLSEAEIRARMTQAGISTRQQDAFFAGLPDPDAPGLINPPLNLLPEYRRFVEMLKHGVPKDEIRAKMTQAGISKRHQDAFFAGLPDPDLPQPLRKQQTLFGQLFGDTAAEKYAHVGGSGWKKGRVPLSSLPMFQKYKHLRLEEARRMMAADGVPLELQQSFFESQPLTDGFVGGPPPVDDPLIRKKTLGRRGSLKNLVSGKLESRMAFGRAMTDLGVVPRGKRGATVVEPAGMRAAAADADGDGHVTRQEHGDWQHFEQVDQDGDGRLSRQEFGQAAGFGADGDSGRFMSGIHAKEAFEMADTDGDGKVSREEFNRYRRFREADADGDGKVSQREFAAYQRRQAELAEEAAQEREGGVAVGVRDPVSMRDAVRDARGGRGGRAAGGRRNYGGVARGPPADAKEDDGGLLSWFGLGDSDRGGDAGSDRGSDGGGDGAAGGQGGWFGGKWFGGGATRPEARRGGARAAMSSDSESVDSREATPYAPFESLAARAPSYGAPGYASQDMGVALRQAELEKQILQTMKINADRAMQEHRERMAQAAATARALTPRVTRRYAPESDATARSPLLWDRK